MILKDLLRIRRIRMTKKEFVVISYLNDKLQAKLGTSYSNVTIEMISEELKIKKFIVRGIVASLVKKNVLITKRWNRDFVTVHFDSQHYLDYKKLIFEKGIMV